MSEKKKSIPLSEEHRMKMSRSKIGKKRKPFTEEHRVNIGNARRGRKHSDGTKAKISVARRNMSPEALERIRAARSRILVTEETRTKISESNKR